MFIDIVNLVFLLGKMFVGKKFEELCGFYFSLKIEFGNIVSWFYLIDEWMDLLYM